MKNPEKFGGGLPCFQSIARRTMPSPRWIRSRNFAAELSASTWKSELTGTSWQETMEEAPPAHRAPQRRPLPPRIHDTVRPLSVNRHVVETEHPRPGSKTA